MLTLLVVPVFYLVVDDAAEWVNFGGGHHITKPDYDVGLLIDLIRAFKRQYRVEVFLEPGEAIAVDTGILVASVPISTAILAVFFDHEDRSEGLRLVGVLVGTYSSIYVASPILLAWQARRK